LEILADDPLAQLDVAEDLRLVDLERRLQEERADLAAVKARNDDMKARLALQERRPTVIARVRAERLTERLGADYRDTRNTLESGDFSAELGASLLKQLDSMPDFNSLRQQ